MKTIKYILLAFIATFVLGGCTETQEFTPGEAEDPNCYGVYFPTPESTDLQLDPAAPTELVLKVRRVKEADAITVPVSIEGSEGIFTASEIEFADGQGETTFKVTFPAAEVGVTYSCSIKIEGKEYASIYSENASNVKFTVSRIKWVQVLGPNGETKGKWRDDVISSMFNVTNANAEIDVEIFMREDKKGLYRVVAYTPELVKALFGRAVGTTTSPITMIDATDPTKVWIPYQSTGVRLGDDGVIEIASAVDKNFSSTAASASLYGNMQDGVITFPAEGVLVNFTVTGGWYKSNASAKQRLMMPGIKDYDYSVGLTKSEPIGGKVNIGVKLGLDVKKVKYEIFKGAFGSSVAAGNSSIIDSDANAKSLVANGTIEVVLDETGMYTIVANKYDAGDKLQGFTYLNFGYIKAGEEVPVVLTYGLDVTNEFAAQGLTKENSMKLYASGKEIKSAKYGLFEKAKVAANANLGALVEKSGSDFTDEQLAKINGDGFAGMIRGLVGGTEYLLVISANNGYVTKVFTATATTEGVAHPLKRTYTIDDFTATQPTKEQYAKDWAYYAVDKNSKTGSTSRIKIGTVSLSDNTTADNDDSDFMNIKGLTGVASQIGGDDSMLIEYYGGVLYTIDGQVFGAYKGMPVSCWWTDTAFKFYSIDYALLGGQVEDGYISFVANPNYIKQGVTFTGVRFLAFENDELEKATAEITWFYDLMLVDPAFDKANPMAMTSSMPAVSREALGQIAKASIVPNNFVELRDRQRMRALIDEYVKAPKSSVNVAVKTTEVAMPSLGVAKAKVSVTPGVATPEFVGELKIKSTAQRIAK